MEIEKFRKLAKMVRLQFPNKEIAELLAVEIRKKLGIKKLPRPTDILRFFEKLKDVNLFLNVDFSPKLKDILKSLSFIHDGQYTIALREGLTEKERLFHICHELGHIILHSEEQAQYKVDLHAKTIKKTKYQNLFLAAETEADIFAQAFLYGRSSEKPVKQIEYIITQIDKHLRVDPIIRSEHPVGYVSGAYADQLPLTPITLINRELLKDFSLIEEFEDLIDDPKTPESQLQEFFEKNPTFLLGSEYKTLKAHIILSKEDAADLIPDFLLQSTTDQMWDIIDIKKPSDIVIVGPPRRRRFSGMVMNACGQLREYKSYFSDAKNQEFIKREYGIWVYKPNIAVIIGQRRSIIPEDFRSAEEDLSELRVITYDDILKKALIFTRWKHEILQ